MAGEDTKFEEFRELIKELSNIEAKILKLEERKNTVRDSVYQKVKDDYETKLHDVEREIENRRAYIEKAFNSCRSEIEALVNQRNGIEEELEELSLRDYLGEFEEGEHERLCQEKKDQLNGLVDKLEDATKRINFLKEFLPDSMRETVPEEVVSTTFEEPPAEGPEAPAKSKAVETTTESAEERPSEFAEEPIEPSEIPAEQVEDSKESLETSVEWQESPEEEGAEEKIPVDMVAAGTHDSGLEETATEVEETTDESVEMLSAQEADQIIEEKISPVDKSAEILKQPELGPDAHEREGVGCPKCGMMNEPDSWYCEKCGAELLVEGAG